METSLIPAHLLEKIKKFKQEHLLEDIKSFDSMELADYIKQLESINFEQVDQVFFINF